jgi:hypothetical protein
MAKKLRFFATIALFAGLSLSFAGTVQADHSWGGYHWARTASPFNLNLGDNASVGWDQYLSQASNDWSQSVVLDTSIIRGGTRATTCKPSQGQVEVCSSKYGQNGWLGLASIWTNAEHITQATVKLNDSYFGKRSPYNTSAWRASVMCQEVGHTLGLDHQDEDFYNSPLGTCMDYSVDPTLNQHPNFHDYEELEIIYSHLDFTSTLSAITQSAHGNSNLDNPTDWGKAVKFSKNGKPSVYENDLGFGQKLYTFVIWTE